MYLINVRDQAVLQPLAEDLDAICEFDHIDLGELNSLSIMEITDNAASDWLTQETVAFNDDQGIAIADFSMDGINWLRDLGEGIAEFGIDPAAVEAFARRCKLGQVYFLDTF